MSRNRLSELQSPPSQSDGGYGAGYGDGYGMNGDLERNDGELAGERYELQERRAPAGQLSLNEYLDEVVPCLESGLM